MVWIVIGAVVLVVLLAAAGLAAAVALGFEPRWYAPARHAWGEAAYRFGGGWADFVDWLRLGR